MNCWFPRAVSFIQIVKLVCVMLVVAVPEITPVAVLSVRPSGRAGEIAQLSRYSRQYEEPRMQVAPIALSPVTPWTTASPVLKLAPSIACLAVSMKNWFW